LLSWTDQSRRFHSAGVLVIWKWELMLHTDSQGSDDSSIELFSDSSDHNSTETPLPTSGTTHTVSFKCIGATKSHDYQSTLRSARDKLRIGENVPVYLVHEPRNPRDTRALAFVCEIGGKTQRIGYIIRELLEGVHAARNAGAIVSTKFAWVRYITEWSRSGPGFFAAINIEKRGVWSANVVSLRSTK